jgi:hypothetical protein
MFSAASRSIARRASATVSRVATRESKRNLTVHEYQGAD